MGWQNPVGGGGWQLSKPLLQRHTFVVFLRLHSLPDGQFASDVHTPGGNSAAHNSTVCSEDNLGETVAGFLTQLLVWHALCQDNIPDKGSSSLAVLAMKTSRREQGRTHQQTERQEYCWNRPWYQPVALPVKTSGRDLLPEDTPSTVHRSSLPERLLAVTVHVESVKTDPAHWPARFKATVANCC